MNNEKNHHRYHIIHKLTKNPYLQFSVGMVLLITTLFDSIFIKFHHSIIILALWHILNAIPNILQSLERIEKLKRKQINKLKFKKNGKNI